LTRQLPTRSTTSQNKNVKQKFTMPVKLKCPEGDCEWVMDQVANTAQPSGNRNMREKMKKQSADFEMSESKWRDFVNHWSLYKRTSGI
jgi:hypothetical protein